MALIEVFHVVATHYPVSPTVTQPFFEGSFVRLNEDGEAVPANATANINIVGVAGDSTQLSSATELATPFSDAITVNAGGATVQTQNRVSDPTGDETLASGRITVYNGGGEFHTDIFETLNGAAVLSYFPGDSLFCSANARLTQAPMTSRQVAVCITAPRAFPSGVPGTDTTDGSLSLGTFITFKLNI